jgi:hypothetical protein
MVSAPVQSSHGDSERTQLGWGKSRLLSRMCIRVRYIRSQPAESPANTILDAGTDCARVHRYSPSKHSRWAGHFAVGERAVHRQ